MERRLLVATLFFAALFTLMSSGFAQAANGTVKYTFKYKDPATGAETQLLNAFLYLRSAAKPPPMEKHFSKADYIEKRHFGNGVYVNSNVPAGTYYVRITQRKVIGQRPFGPPEAGDYTWFQTTPITVVAGQTIDLGTLYAVPFGPAPITIKGRVVNQRGEPVAGQYVRAQSQPCYDDGYNYNVNQCGPDKNLALKPTDADGNYTILLRDPGPYYLYTSPCLTTSHSQYTGNTCGYTAAAVNPVVVKIEDVKTVDLQVFRYP